MSKELARATLTERLLLSDPLIGKKTYHLVLKYDTPFRYEVGDCLAIHPHHSKELVERTLRALGAGFHEPAVHPRSGEEKPLGALLTTDLSIGEASRKLVQEAAKLYPELAEKDLKTFPKSRTVARLLEEYPLPLQLVISSLPPLLPRFYSIASSSLLHPDEVHLTVALVEYEEEGEKRFGVASHYLAAELELGDQIVTHLHPHRGFTLPKDVSLPIIMVGPGTGVAPFRAFLQERNAFNSQENWLFFGERSAKGGFYYQSFFESLKASGHLKLSLAFSRDQSEKIYVQHRMQEEGSELLRWIDQGASLYVCGDMQRMAKDVEETLLHLFMREKGMTLEAARGEVTTLRKEGRYLRDVY